MYAFQQSNQMDTTPRGFAGIEADRRVYSYSKGRVFYRPGDSGHTLFRVVSGEVAVYMISVDGRRLLLDVLSEGDLFGYSMLTNNPAHTFAEAFTDCEVEKYSRDDIQHLMSLEPQMMFDLIQTAVERAQLIEKRLEEVTFLPIHVRLARLLLELADTHGKDGMVMGFSHQLMADMLGVYRETVTQSLSQMKKDGIISLGRLRFNILDEDALENAAFADGMAMV